MWVYYVENDCSISIEDMDMQGFDLGNGCYSSLREAKKAAKEMAKEKVGDIKQSIKYNQKLSPKMMKYGEKLRYWANKETKVIQDVVDGLLEGINPEDKYPLGHITLILRERLEYHIYSEGSGWDNAGYSTEGPTYLEYIQDRWKCAYRVAYLLHGLESGKLVEYWCDNKEE